MWGTFRSDFWSDVGHLIFGTSSWPSSITTSELGEAQSRGKILEELSLDKVFLVPMEETFLTVDATS